MKEKIYKLTLGDGTVISGLRMNGNNFISLSPISESIFEDNLTEVVINDGENDEVHDQMALVQITQMGSEYWFILRDLSAKEIEQQRMWAAIDYIAMMTEVDF